MVGGECSVWWVGSVVCGGWGVQCVVGGEGSL